MMNVETDITVGPLLHWYAQQKGVLYALAAGDEPAACKELYEKGLVEFMESIGTIEAVKTVADLFAPVSGTVTEINGALEDNPETVNNSPFEDGWFIKVTLSDAGEVDRLMDRGAYEKFIGS